MKRRLFFWEAGGFFFTAAAGVLLHFVYRWSGGGALVAVVSSVNGSVWEQMKLLFLPLFFFSLVQLCREGRNYPNLLAVRSLSGLTGLLLIPILFYSYTGALGLHLPWADGVIFFLADLALFCLDYRLLRRGRFSSLWQQLLGLVLLWGLVFCFVWCAFHPPALPLWQERAPQTAVLQRGLPHGNERFP